MFDTIVVPVDLGHTEQVDKALTIAAGLARTHEAALHVVGVTGAPPGATAHTPAEHAERLEAWAQERSATLEMPITTHSVAAHDPQVDMEARILDEAHRLKADLIVMATRVPGFAERLFSAHGAALARQADISVFLVR